MTIPVRDGDGNWFAYDQNSVVLNTDQKGTISGADVVVRVVQGEATIEGRTLVLTFDCVGHDRINHSYPMSLPSAGPEQFAGNFACGRAQCELWRRQTGKSICTFTD